MRYGLYYQYIHNRHFFNPVVEMQKCCRVKSKTGEVCDSYFDSIPLYDYLNLSAL
jgi:hypothetical protein